MRSLFATSALALSAAASFAALSAPAPARADGFAFGAVSRLSAQMTQVDRMNRVRARDQVYGAIAHQIDMINDRFADLQTRRMAPRQALSMIDDSLYAILQYNQNAGFEAPWASAQIRRLVSEMRADIAALQQSGELDYGRGPGRGYDRGYGRGYGYGHAGYVPGRPERFVPAPGRYYTPPAPSPVPVYVPPPAPAYQQAPCDRDVRPIRY